MSERKCTNCKKCFWVSGSNRCPNCGLNYTRDDEPLTSISAPAAIAIFSDALFGSTDTNSSSTDSTSSDSSIGGGGDFGGGGASSDW